MSRLQAYWLDDAAMPMVEVSDPGMIASTLATIGVRFEQWPARPLPADAGPEAVLQAFAPEVERLKTENGYQAVDVMRVQPDHPDREALRTKFLSEHRHSEDEVRFFVEGEGLFTLREDDRVYAVLCTAGDLISVPAGMRHWFDMGAAPSFTVIRLYIDPAGWVANYTGDTIADRFPRHEREAA
ncbi:cupin domain-containing protein [Sphingomonas sp. LB-2]|uniref:1,2-dihydroxy-3-keto-5-methylthiopentene dioxygenase n=1 Tax=Sphingomonas caeni TaxID=2984949 RepID=UPI00222ECE8D|nr:cupin domain-containing protein [Sphingomonas caeni]MCW3848216.1 cupin domain-containing protein [Sphingomonas caeni]